VLKHGCEYTSESPCNAITGHEGSSRLTKTSGYLAAIGAPIICFYGILAHHLLNLPLGDDYETVLPFMARLTTMDWLHRLGYTSQFQHNEYKLIFENAIFAAQYAILGHPNFIILCLLGDLLVLVLFFGIWHCLAPKIDPDQKLMAAVPIAFVLFELRYAETLNSSMAALQNIAVLIFSLFCVACLTRARDWMACLFFALSVASSGNGFLLLPIGIWLMARRRSWRQLAAWIAVFAAIAAIYFAHYVRGSSNNAPVTPMRMIQRLNPIYTLSFMGSLVGLQWMVSALVGAAVLFVFVLMVRKRYERVNPTVFYFAIFLILTAIAVAGIRSDLGLYQSFTGRYRIYSILLLICCYIFGMENSERWFRPALVTSILICIMGDVYGHLYYRRRRSEILQEAVIYSQDLCGNDALCHTRHQALVEARNIYRLPSIDLRGAIAGAWIGPVAPGMPEPRGERGAVVR
jgi:hypothetical protein